MMKFSILINNYNYGRYLRECLDSVLGQTYPAHEIIVVDDGSTDDSLQILIKHFGNNAQVKIIPQFNQGQSAAVGRGIEAATGDIVCLLDADDRYKPEYLATLKAHYTEFPKTDLTFCRYEFFGKEAERANGGIWLSPKKDYDYGYTALLAYFGNIYWLGNITSTISLRIRLARVLKLHELAREFYIQGQCDFPVLLGASLLGGRKFYLHRVLTDHRVHDASDYAALQATPDTRFKHDLNDLIRWEHFKRRSCIMEGMFYRLHEEAMTVPDPDPRHLEYYRELSRSRRPLTKITSTMDRKLQGMRKKLFGKKA